MMSAVSFRGHTTGEGPIVFGMCSSSLTVSELDAWFANDPQGLEGSAQEISDRQVVVWGVIPETPLLDSDQSPIMFRSRKWYWEVKEGQGVQYFARNQDSGALTTGIVIQFQTFISGVWLDD